MLPIQNGLIILIRILCHFVVCSSWLWVLGGLPIDERQQIYGASILLGIGCSMLLVTSLAMTAELVGDNTVSQLIRSLAYRFLQ